MITAIDTNILIDILIADKKFGEASANALKKCIEEGSICACEIVWTETATIFSQQEDFRKTLQMLSIEFSPLNERSSLLAADAWRKYRKNGGKRERVVADFLIGAHAINQCERLLTRDRGFYRKYFHSLKIVNPAEL